MRAMRPHTRMGAALLAAAMLLTFGLVVAFTAGGQADPGSRPHATGAPTYFPQSGLAAAKEIRPRTLQISGDGSLFLRPVVWSTWTPTVARGMATSMVNTCRPNCAQGSFIKHRVAVTLDRPVALCGHRFFSRIRIDWPGARKDTVISPYRAYCTR